MNEEIHKVDACFASDIRDSNGDVMKVYHIIEQALIKFGLRETAREFKRAVIK